MTPLDYLFGLELHGIKLGLDNITQLLGEAGDPQHAYPSVHIGGTNGKGSVVAMLDAMFRSSPSWTPSCKRLDIVPAGSPVRTSATYASGSLRTEE